MNTTDLSAMHDIIVPPFQSSYWPLALGYWLVLISLVILIVGCTIFFIYYTKKYRARTQALKELKLMSHQELSVYSALIKRVAIHYYGRESIARLSGKTWLKQLKSWAPQTQHPTLETLFSERYQPQHQPSMNLVELQPLFKKIIIQCSKKKGVLHAHS